MKTRAALQWEQPDTWDVREVELDPPKHREVLVKMVATGLCHSDDHGLQGDIPMPHLPNCGGHEGSGIVQEVGPGVTTLTPGDHIVTTFIPACGHCRWCQSGSPALCDNGAILWSGTQLDGTFRMHVDGKDIARSSMIGTFAEWSVMHETSCVKIDKDVSLVAASLLGCGVPTGWGSAVYSAGVKPGEVVLVVGVGGIGMNAVQGAKHCGAAHIVVVDPVEFKREVASCFGATQCFDNIDAATELIRSLTNGQGADAAIVAVGVTRGEHIAQGFSAIRKGGTVVATGIGNAAEVGLPINLFELSMYQKRIQGTLCGHTAAGRDILLLVELYRSGQLKLDELITRKYDLSEINQGYADMHAGKNIRGVVVFD